MILHPLGILPAALVLASAAAQAPGNATANPTRSECAMQSLQALTSETIYQRQPLSAAPDGHGAASGTASDQRFARIRDARFDRSGRLVDLIVEMPDEATSPSAVRRLLAAEAATWDDTAKRWITTDINLKFVALPEAPKPEQAADNKDKTKKGQTVLASELLLAPAKIAPPKVVAADPAGEPAADASLTKAPKTAAILWFVPAERTISFVVVPYGEKHVPLPWSMVRVADQASGLHLANESHAAKLADAPLCKDAMEQPSQELRQRCYQHYGVACPKWDRPSGEVEPNEPVTKRDDKAKER